MIRLFNTYFPIRVLLLCLSEAFLVSLAFVTATLVWFGSEADFRLTYEHGLAKIALVTAVFLLSMYYLDLYDTMVLSDRREILSRLLQVLGVGTVALALAYYLYPETRLSRSVFVLGAALLVPLLFFWREVFSGVVQAMHLSERAIILGSGSLACALAHDLQRRPETGIQLLGYLDFSRSSETGDHLRYLGSADRLAELVERYHADRIIVAMGERRGKLPVDQLLALRGQGVMVQDGNDLCEAILGKIPVDSICPSWLLFSPAPRSAKALLVYKRLSSVVGATVGLLLSFPTMALIALAVRLDSPGPIIFRQRRVGKDGKIFTLYKFRSMRDVVEREGKDEPARERDGRFTRVGHWLRRTRLDELPQLYNILRGDMSFVGPRPFVPSQEEECAREIPFYRYRWTVKPGATGWAQINRGYCMTLKDNTEKISYDLYYIKNMSMGLDVVILFRTIKILLLGRGAQ